MMDDSESLKHGFSEAVSEDFTLKPGESAKEPLSLPATIGKNEPRQPLQTRVRGQQAADREKYWQRRIDRTEDGATLIPYSLWSFRTNILSMFGALGSVCLAILVGSTLTLILSFIWSGNGTFLGYRVNNFSLTEVSSGWSWNRFLESASVWLVEHGLHNANRMDDVLRFLPWMAVACVGTTIAVAYVSRTSKARAIDWTDSYLLLEYNDPLSLALKWSSIESVTQISQWELFHGHQPAFVVTTHLGKRFRLRLSDITQKHNIGEFFSLVKTNAPKATLVVDPNFARDNCYTELWLKYFSTPVEREKTGLLQPGMSIDGGRYRVVGTVGGGGQGTAYLCRFDSSVTHSALHEPGRCCETTEHISCPQEKSSRICRRWF